jgi:hypothetical protein
MNSAGLPWRAQQRAPPDAPDHREENEIAKTNGGERI